MNSTFLDFGIVQIKWYSIFIFLAMLAACLIIFKETAIIELTPIFAGYIMLGIHNTRRERKAVEIK